MTLNAEDLENEFREWLRQIPTAEARKAAEEEILSLFSAEPNEQHQWTEQDIYEQSRKIIRKYE